MTTAGWVERLDGWLRTNRAAFHAGLRPGATPATLAKAQAKLSAFPEGVAELFAWRQGPHGGRLQANFSLMSLAEAVGTTTMLNVMLASGEFDRPGWWSPTWLPFLDNGGGDHVCVDLDGGEVSEFWHDEVWRTRRYPSFMTWLQVFVTALERGVYTVDADYGFVEADDAALAAVMHELAPGYPITRDAGAAPAKPPKPVPKKATRTPKAKLKSKPARKSKPKSPSKPKAKRSPAAKKRR